MCACVLLPSHSAVLKRHLPPSFPNPAPAPSAVISSAEKCPWWHWGMTQALSSFLCFTTPPPTPSFPSFDLLSPSFFFFFALALPLSPFPLPVSLSPSLLAVSPPLSPPSRSLSLSLSAPALQCWLWLHTHSRKHTHAHTQERSWEARTAAACTNRGWAVRGHEEGELRRENSVLSHTSLRVHLCSGGNDAFQDQIAYVIRPPLHCLCIPFTLLLPLQLFLLLLSTASLDRTTDWLGLASGGWSGLPRLKDSSVAMLHLHLHWWLDCNWYLELEDNAQPARNLGCVCHSLPVLSLAHFLYFAGCFCLLWDWLAGTAASGPQDPWSGRAWGPRGDPKEGLECFHCYHCCWGAYLDFFFLQKRVSGGGWGGWWQHRYPGPCRAERVALASRQAGRPVGKGGRRVGSSVGLLMVAIFVSPSWVIGTAGGREDAYGPRHSAGWGSKATQEVAEAPGLYGRTGPQ